MTVAKLQTTLRRSAMYAGLAAVLAIGLVGAALMIQRGPDLAALASIAERPVVMPDGRQLFVQKYEVTVAEWNACHDAGECPLAPRAPAGRTDLTTPATGLSFVDVGEYLAWINRTTGHDFRLPTLAERAHMAAKVLPEEPDPIFTAPELTWASAYLTIPQTEQLGAPPIDLRQGGR